MADKGPRQQAASSMKDDVYQIQVCTTNKSEKNMLSPSHVIVNPTKNYLVNGKKERKLPNV
jgi:hypothetical protein